MVLQNRNPAYNVQLSKDRAQAVQNALKKYFDPDQVTFSVSGRGETVPIATNETENGRAKNRRVVIELFFL